MSPASSLGEVEGATEVRCKVCGTILRRLKREGFMQQKIYSTFGFYPWECPICRKPVLVKQQYMRKKRSDQNSAA